MMVHKKRELTEEEIEISDNLKKIWKRKKKEEGLSQIEVCEKWGIAQPTFSQYLNRIIPVNTDMILKFAALLDVNPADINPALNNFRQSFSVPSDNASTTTIPLLGSITGAPAPRSVKVKIPYNDLVSSEGYFGGILVDNKKYENYDIQKGSIITVDMLKENFNKDDRVVIRRSDNSQFEIFQYFFTKNGKTFLYTLDGKKQINVSKREMLNIYQVITISKAIDTN